MIQRGDCFCPNCRLGSGVDILFLLIPLSVVLALLVLGALWWAVWRGQFDALEGEAERILDSD